jgi:hypothetical protein
VAGDPSRLRSPGDLLGIAEHGIEYHRCCFHLFFASEHLFCLVGWCPGIDLLLRKH